MPNLISDVLTKFNALPWASAPSIYFGPVPLTDAAGAQVYPPYAALSLNQTGSEQLSRLRRLVTYSVTFAYFDTDATAVSDFARMVQYGPGDPGQFQGFDGGSLAVTEGSLNYLRSTGDPEFFTDDKRDRGNQLVHGCRLRYDIEIILGG